MEVIRQKTVYSSSLFMKIKVKNFAIEHALIQRGAPNTFKIPLNWQKFTKKILGASPQNPVAPLSSDPGSATD